MIRAKTPAMARCLPDSELWVQSPWLYSPSAFFSNSNLSKEIHTGNKRAGGGQ